MPFANLPDEHVSRWGESLTVEKMKECLWLRPEVLAQVEFLKWTDADRLRHSIFVGLREDKDARQVVKEHSLAANWSCGRGVGFRYGLICSTFSIIHVSC
jgi:ATP-dependent DNA ligase